MAIKIGIINIINTSFHGYLGRPQINCFSSYYTTVSLGYYLTSISGSNKFAYVFLLYKLHKTLF